MVWCPQMNTFLFWLPLDLSRDEQPVNLRHSLTTLPSWSRLEIDWKAIQNYIFVFVFRVWISLSVHKASSRIAGSSINNCCLFRHIGQRREALPPHQAWGVLFCHTTCMYFDLLPTNINDWMCGNHDAFRIVLSYYYYVIHQEHLLRVLLFKGIIDIYDSNYILLLLYYVLKTLLLSALRWLTRRDKKTTLHP